MKVPNIENPAVLRFCKSINASVPLMVELVPVKRVPLNECFIAVPKQVAACGGKAVTGWAIWEWSGVLIEAEFHCVWQRLDGSLVDIVPKPKAFDAILFLPDAKKQYRGVQVDNVRKPMINSLMVRNYIATANARFLAERQLDLANHQGEVEARNRFIKLHNKMAGLQDKLVKKFGAP
jgi:hypothetical protein